MGSLPPVPKVYHITHVDDLPSIAGDGEIWSDAIMASRGGPPVMIGMSEIKKRRLTLPVPCHPGTCVGDYVPFNFCPRSVMLYVIHKGNNPGLAYKDGQGKIVHLEADLHSVVTWARRVNRPWAFSLSNASAYYTQFDCNVERLDRLDWAAIANRDFRDPDVQEAKQAEFLVYGSFPWSLVTRVGVYSREVQTAAYRAIQSGSHRPAIEVMPNWYY